MDNSTVVISLYGQVINLTKLLQIATDALDQITKESGKVCAGFELCTHESCQSSYAAWVIADDALAAIANSLTKGNTDDL